MVLVCGLCGEGDLAVLVLQCSFHESYSQPRVCVKAEAKVEPTWVKSRRCGGWKCRTLKVLTGMCRIYSSIAPGCTLMLRLPGMQLQLLGPSFRIMIITADQLNMVNVMAKCYAHFIVTFCVQLISIYEIDETEPQLLNHSLFFLRFKNLNCSSG